MSHVSKFSEFPAGFPGCMGLQFGFAQLRGGVVWGLVICFDLGVGVVVLWVLCVDLRFVSVGC